MVARIQVVLSEEDRERFRREAQREHMSLSGWLRAAGEDRLRRSVARGRIESRDALAEFFRACDAREVGREPEWDEHLKVMERSRGIGRSGT